MKLIAIKDDAELSTDLLVELLEEEMKRQHLERDGPFIHEKIGGDPYIYCRVKE